MARGRTARRSARPDVLDRREQVHQRLEHFRDAAGAQLAPLLRDELWPVVVRYNELKQRAGQLDFMDLLLMARDLVRDNAVVRAELPASLHPYFHR